MFYLPQNTTDPVVAGYQIFLSLQGSHFHPCLGKTVDALVMQLVTFWWYVLYAHLKDFVAGWVSGMYYLVVVIHYV
jgi:hypothetical protein